MRELLRHPRQPLEVFESILAALRVAGAEAGRDELFDERSLAPRAGHERAQMARVDPESSKTRAGAGDIRLALAVETLPAFGAGHEETELLELAHEVVGHGCALAELALVDLVLVTEHAYAPSPRPIVGRSWAVELLADHPQRKELVALQLQDRRQPLDVVRREEPVSPARASWRDEALIFEVPDLRHRDVRKLLAQLLAVGADRAEARVRPSPLPPCRDRAHR